MKEYRVVATVMVGAEDADIAARKVGRKLVDDVRLEVVSVRSEDPDLDEVVGSPYWRADVRQYARRALAGAYVCDRSWSAWSYGTMGEDDFFEADEDHRSVRDVEGVLSQFAAVLMRRSADAFVGWLVRNGGGVWAAKRRGEIEHHLRAVVMHGGDLSAEAWDA